MKNKTARCSKCGKKIRLLKGGFIASHESKTMASRTRHMRRPDLDDYVVTTYCPGSHALPHKGKWRGEVGWRR
jgi:hypothetical protein